MTVAQIQELLKTLHEQENVLNREGAKLDLQIKSATKRKAVLAKRVSKNMRYRNHLIENLSRLRQSQF